jgi:hypothetical protein
MTAINISPHNGDISDTEELAGIVPQMLNLACVNFDESYFWWPNGVSEFLPLFPVVVAFFVGWALVH